MGVNVAADAAGAATELTTRVTEMLPGILERAPLGDERRNLPDQTAQALIEAGVMRAMVPRESGGDDLPLEVLREVTRLIATVDASAAWCAGLSMDHAITVGMYPLEAQAEVWSSGPDVPIASSIIPAVGVETVDGGFRLRGAAPFSSFSYHCDWALIGGILPGESPLALMCLVPARDYVVQDTWQALGMRGTGTNTLILDGVFVPTYRAMPFADLNDGTGPGSLLRSDPKFRVPWVMYSTIGHAATVLGAAQGAFAHYCETLSQRRGIGGIPVKERAQLQEATGRIAARLDAAEALLTVLTSLIHEPPYALEVRSRSTVDYAFSSRLALEAVEEMIRVTGMAAHMAGSRLERAARDIRTACSHIALSFEAHAAHHGRTVLGVPRPPEQAFF